jgi:hypothetical protein
VDLSEFLYSAPDIEISEYYENCIELFRRNDSLYKVFPSFTLSALAVRRDSLNGNDDISWNEDEFIDFVSRNGLFEEVNYNRFMERVSPAIVRSCCDYSDYNCNFTGKGFKNIIKAVSENSQDNDFGTFGSVVEGTSSLDEIVIDKNPANLLKYSDDIVFKGYPVEQGNGIIVTPEFSFSISVNCVNTQTAWEFVKSFITDDYQRDMIDQEEYYTRGIPIKKSYAEKCFSGEIYNFAAGGMLSVSESMKKKIDELITTADCPNNLARNSRELKIIQEEAGRFFSGEIDENTMASTVQNKVSLFFSEIK